MNVSNFFLSRPRFAGVLSLIIVLAGLVCLPLLPVSEYPEVVPPTVVVRTTYAGADVSEIAETVAAPLEQAINGVEGMLYQSSQSTADGVMTLTITFALGTNPDQAQVLVQNRVAQVLSRLPPEVQKVGVTTDKSSPDLIMVAHLTSDVPRYDMLYLSSYAQLHIKDALARDYGVGQIQQLGAGPYSMRIWLDPDKLAADDMTAGDVVKALREQNVQVAAGDVGASPTAGKTAFQMSLNATGRLTTEEQFSDIILRTDDEGRVTHLRDVARVELGSDGYGVQALLDDKPAVALGIFLRPGANALKMEKAVKATMADLSKDFPQGIHYSTNYDTTGYVHESIDAVVHTLFEAILLVVLVVVVFLQSWRASIIPLIAVPVSLVGTFAVMKVLGFGFNALSLFGLVLAIGIVVDDAIVVVENVQRNIELGHPPLEAARHAMREVTGPIISTALVLCAVFVPTAFITGLTGQFYRQFALTIAISTVISAFNSLTLSPALAAVLLKASDARKDWLERAMERGLGWLFRPFNRLFDRARGGYVGLVQRGVRRSSIGLALYVGLIGLTVFAFSKAPPGFVPPQDKLYLAGMVQLPSAATVDRTRAVLHQMDEIALKTPGVSHTFAFPGLSIDGLVANPSSGAFFAILDDFSARRGKGRSAAEISQTLSQKFAALLGGQALVFPPPPVQGIGTIGGFRMQLEDRTGLGAEALNKATQDLVSAAAKDPRLAGVFSSYQIGVPKVHADIDREKARVEGVALSDLFETLQIYLGSLYVNDFNRFGRTYQVNVQADQAYRMQPEDVERLQTRNAAGQMIPLGAFVTTSLSTGPDHASHYNGYLTAEINGVPGPGYSTGQAQKALEEIAAKSLPQGMGYEWTGLTYQQILAGDTALYVFPICVLLAFLVLVAQYESWTLPLVVILIVPMCLLCALLGVLATKSDNNVFTQIGLIVLVGLACKNAILIVEFAREREIAGEPLLTAILDACRLRLRPILMTSIAFIMGVLPLALATGAGSEMRRAMGVAVFAGMLGVTLFGLALTPVFYWTIRRLTGVRPLQTRRGGVPIEAAADRHPPEGALS